MGERITQNVQPSIYAVRLPEPLRDYMKELIKAYGMRNYREFTDLVMGLAVEEKPWSQQGWAWIAPRVSKKTARYNDVQLNITMSAEYEVIVDDIRDQTGLSANSILMTLFIWFIDKKLDALTPKSAGASTNESQEQEA